jgi:hypothetical protein
MIRIDIDWDFISPAMGVASGILKVISYKHNGALDEGKILIKCNVKKERGSLGFNAISQDKGVRKDLFDIFDDRIKTMIDCYYRGMNLENSAYSWIDDSADKSLEQYLKEKGFDYSEECINKIVTQNET